MAENRITSKFPEMVKMMATPMAAEKVLDREFLEVRAKLLELAASFDRLDRGGGVAAGEQRMKLVRQALKVLLDETGDRAEQIQLLFSRDYNDDWQKAFGMLPQPPEATQE